VRDWSFELRCAQRAGGNGLRHALCDHGIGERVAAEFLIENALCARIE